MGHDVHLWQKYAKAERILRARLLELQTQLGQRTAELADCRATVARQSEHIESLELVLADYLSDAAAEWDEQVITGAIRLPDLE